jgi:FkbM family methyltransferase
MKQVVKTVRNRMLSTVTDGLADLQRRVAGLEQRQQQVQDATFHIQKAVGQTIMPISDKEIVAKIFNGVKFYLDPRDISVVPHLAMDGIWEGFITNAWLSVIKAESVVFDVGANFGYFGVLAANAVNRKKSKVVFFEPNPNLLPYIDKTLSVNWLNENAVIEHMGIDKQAGEVELNILKDYIGCSSMHSIEHLDEYLHDKMHLEVAEKVLVKTISIDEYCTKHDIDHIDLIKIDIEGYEENAYAGMRGMVAKSPDMVLFLEFTKESYQNPKGFYEQMLADFDGQVHVINSDGTFVSPEDTSYESVLGNAEDWEMLVFSKKSLK